MANPSLQIGNGKFAIKENELLGYSSSGTRFFPIPITMTRATLGTRVNPSGLIEDVELLGSELVDCGNFECAVPTDSWSTGTGWDISGGVANFDSTGQSTNSLLQQVVSENIDGIVNVDFSSGINTYTFNNGVKTFTLNFTFSKTSGTDRIRVITSGSTLYFSALNGDGLIGSINNVSVKEATIDGLARVDYTDGTGSLLVEPQRTNLVTYSEDFSQWSLSNSTLISDYSDSIFGGKKSYLMTSTASPSAIYTAISSTNNTQTFFVKKGNHNYIQILNFGSSQFYGNFDIDSGIVGSKGTLTDSSTIEDLGNGWYKISCYFVGSITSTRLYFSESLTAAYGGGTTSSGLTVELAGCQSEVGSYPTSYIKTQGSSVTRNQDQYSKAGISNLINSEEGVLFVEVAALSDDGTNRYLSISDGTTSNYIYFRFVSTSNTVLMRTVVATSTINTLQTAISDTTAYNKFAFKWKSGDYAFWINGVEALVDTSATIFSADVLNTIEFSFPTAGGGGFPSKVKQLQVYKTSLSDTQLAALTS